MFARIRIGTIVALLLTLALVAIVFASYPLAAHGSGGSGTGIGSVGTLKNPIKAQSIQEFIYQIIDIILVFATAIIVFFIILAGFKYVTANGNEEKVKSATSALTWAVIGGVLVLGAKILLEVIQNTVKALQV